MGFYYRTAFIIVLIVNNTAMDDFDKILNVLLAMQEKHRDFFENSQSLITDYIEIPTILLPVLKIKNGLPKNIVDDICKHL